MAALWSTGAPMATASPATTITIPAGATSADNAIIGLVVSDNNSTGKTYTLTTSGSGTSAVIMPITTATNSSAKAWSCVGLKAGDTVTITGSSAVNGCLIAAGYAGTGFGNVGAPGVHAASPDSTTVTAPGFTATAANSTVVSVFTSRLGSGTNTPASVSPGTVDAQFTAGNDGTSIAITSSTPGTSTVPAATITWGTALHNGLGVSAEITQAAPSSGRKVFYGGTWHNATIRYITAAAGANSIPFAIPFTISGG